MILQAQLSYAVLQRPSSLSPKELLDLALFTHTMRSLENCSLTSQFNHFGWHAVPDETVVLYRTVPQSLSPCKSHSNTLYCIYCHSFRIDHSPIVYRRSLASANFTLITD